MTFVITYRTAGYGDCDFCGRGDVGPSGTCPTCGAADEATERDREDEERGE